MIAVSTMYGGVDGDTEVNGFEMNGQFTDVVWMPATLQAGAVPPFAVMPLVGVPCYDVTVTSEQDVMITTDDCEMVVA